MAALRTNIQFHPDRKTKVLISQTLSHIDSKGVNLSLNTLQAGLNVDGSHIFGDIFFVRGHYSLDHYAYYDAAREDMTFHRLNAVIGVLLLKGRLSLSLSGNNLLDRDTSYVLTRNLAGSHETWAPSMGRYYLLTASFRLNKTKPATSFRGWN